jgi:hypothetical protein
VRKHTGADNESGKEVRWFEESLSLDETSPNIIVGNPERNLNPAPFGLTGSEDAVAYKHPATYSAEKVFGQYIFSLFMIGLSKFLSDSLALGIGGKSRIGDTYTEGILTNSTIDRFAEIFLDYELGTKEEAYVCIVPNLASSKLLPRFTESGLPLDITSGLNVLLKRNRSIALLRGLFDVMEALSEDTRINAIIVAEDAAGKYGTTALHLASSWGREEVANHLMDTSDANMIKRIDQSGRTALHMASRSGHKDIVQLLADKGGADLIKMTDQSGQTALHMALRSGHKRIVQLLADKGGADLIKMTDYEGQTALDLSEKPLFRGLRRGWGR